MPYAYFSMKRDLTIKRINLKYLRMSLQRQGRDILKEATDRTSEFYKLWKEVDDLAGKIIDTRESKPRWIK